MHLGSLRSPLTFPQGNQPLEDWKTKLFPRKCKINNFEIHFHYFVFSFPWEKVGRRRFHSGVPDADGAQMRSCSFVFQLSEPSYFLILCKILSFEKKQQSSKRTLGPASFHSGFSTQVTSVTKRFRIRKTFCFGREVSIWKMCSSSTSLGHKFFTANTAMCRIVSEWFQFKTSRKNAISSTILASHNLFPLPHTTTMR